MDTKVCQDFRKLSLSLRMKLNSRSQFNDSIEENIMTFIFIRKIIQKLKEKTFENKKIEFLE